MDATLGTRDATFTFTLNYASSAVAGANARVGSTSAARPAVDSRHDDVNCWGCNGLLYQALANTGCMHAERT